MFSRNHSLEHDQERGGERPTQQGGAGEHEDADDENDQEGSHQLHWTEGVESVPVPLTPDVLAELNGPRFLSRGSNSFDFFLGLRQLHVALEEHAVTYFLRPDVTADSVFSLIEQVEREEDRGERDDVCKIDEISAEFVGCRNCS